MSILIARKKRKDELPLFDHRRLYATCKFHTRPNVVPQFPKCAFETDLINYFVPVRRLKVTRIRRRIGLDDSESRVAIWRALFKDEPMPSVEEGAVEKYAGSLDKYLPENVPIHKVISHAKKG